MPSPSPERRQQTVRELLDAYNIDVPKTWNKLSYAGKLDHIATRILAMSRTTTSHTAMREEGILSVSQYDRRVAREVYSVQGGLDQVPVVRGIFGRVHRKLDRPNPHVGSDD